MLRYVYKTVKEGRVYLLPDCVISSHRECYFVKSNYTKPSKCAIRGKKMHHFIKFVLITMVNLIINEIVIKVKLAGHMLISKTEFKAIHIYLQCSILDHLLKAGMYYRNVKQEDISDIFVKTNLKKPAVSIKEQLLIKFYIITHLILLQLQKMMSIKGF